jgi:hypothetical protein
MSSQLWGYIDRDGDLAIPFQYDLAEPFIEGLAIVRYRGSSGFIDLSGKWVIPPVFEGLGPFAGDLAPAKRGGKYGYINRSGQFVIPPSFESASSFRYGLLAKVEINNSIGYIDCTGKLVIPACYKFAEMFQEGFAVVCDPENYPDKWFIDESGARRFGPFPRADSFSEEWAAVVDKRGCRYIDASGKTVLHLPKKIFGHRFREGLAPAEDQSKGEEPWQGYINRRGLWAIAPEFNSAAYFRNNFAVVRIGKKKGLIDRKGSYLVPAEYDDIDDLVDDRIRFMRFGCYGYFNGKGDVVIEPAYYPARSFSEGLAPVCHKST